LLWKKKSSPSCKSKGKPVPDFRDDFGFLADITGQRNELSCRLQYKVRTSLFMLFDCAKGSEETGVMETVVEE
jgi:hypothetical protein